MFVSKLGHNMVRTGLTGGPFLVLGNYVGYTVDSSNNLATSLSEGIGNEASKRKETSKEKTPKK